MAVRALHPAGGMKAQRVTSAIVIVNQKAGQPSGSAAGAEREIAAEIGQALRAAGIESEVRLTPAERIGAEAQAAVDHGADVVVAGGGDGTLNAVASILAGGETPMGVLALGTLNHFAKDLHIPLSIAEAARVIAAGHVARVDVGRVNDRIFLNNSSLGVYARAIIDRDERRRRLGLGKWPAMALAMLKTFRRSPLLHVRLDADAESRTRRTPLVFVGNNQYQLDLLNIGARSCLHRGELSLYVANTSSRWGLLKLAVRTALGRLEQSRDFETQCTSHVLIETRRRQLHVALDGEVTLMTPPLDYRSWPGALRVLAPPPNDAGEASRHDAAAEQHTAASGGEG